MQMRCLRIPLQCVASLIWALAGVSKIVTPAPALVAGFALGPGFVVAFGLLEILIASFMWVPALRRGAAFVSMLAASLFAAAMLAGVVAPETCACFGALKLAKARHLMVVSLMVVVSAAAVLIDRHSDSQGVT